MRRRAFLVCGGCFAVQSAFSALEAAAQWPQGDRPGSGRRLPGSHTTDGIIGCHLSGAQSGRDGGPRFVRSSGDPMLDQLLRREAQFLNQFYGVAPGLAYVDDSGSPNAFATRRVLFGGADGTVAMGVELLREELRAGGGSRGNAVSAIMAHEWGHILQYAHHVDVPGKPMELSADFLAGWYVGIKALHNVPYINIATVGRSLFEKGDYAFNSPDHHGTPRERVRAMQDGFALAVERRILDSAMAFRVSAQVSGL